MLKDGFLNISERLVPGGSQLFEGLNFWGLRNDFVMKAESKEVIFELNIFCKILI